MDGFMYLLIDGSITWSVTPTLVAQKFPHQGQWKDTDWFIDWLIDSNTLRSIPSCVKRVHKTAPNKLPVCCQQLQLLRREQRQRCWRCADMPQRHWLRLLRHGTTGWLLQFAARGRLDTQVSICLSSAVVHRTFLPYLKLHARRSFGKHEIIAHAR